MEKFKVLVDEYAIDELTRHIAFLANKSQKAAMELYTDIFDIIDSLEALPDRYPVYLTPYSSYEHRMAVHKYYLILYRIDKAGSTIYVRRILDGRADNRV